MARPVYVEHALPFDCLLIGLGALLFVLGILDFYAPELFDVGGWGYYLVSIGFIVLLAGVLLLYGYVKRVRSFNKMMAVKSKKEFVAIKDELEYTAWRLPSRFDEKVANKKKEFDVK
ncbi:MAG: hypothetical protein HPY73_05150 [Methanomassiliicoccales archaeon]|nr:MAG: hypothetical protein HPY73_05150 [Methanomassiliicoccales archaeon]